MTGAFETSKPYPNNVTDWEPSIQMPHSYYHTFIGNLCFYIVILSIFKTYKYIKILLANYSVWVMRIFIIKFKNVASIMKKILFFNLGKTLDAFEVIYLSTNAWI